MFTNVLHGVYSIYKHISQYAPSMIALPQEGMLYCAFMF